MTTSILLTDDDVLSAAEKRPGIFAKPINPEPTREWCRPYLPWPWVRESPVTQNLEEFGSSHLGSGRLRVVPASCGSFPYCKIWGSRGWVKGHYMDAGTITIAKRSGYNCFWDGIEYFFSHHKLEYSIADGLISCHESAILIMYVSKPSRILIARAPLRLVGRSLSLRTIET
ncbi:uncharacterized protein G2W53_017465 [Senna tora]|uniref:Uncharacterized protein n=1 Tax=Senna tora TaxID=362788 RepID=A0A834TSU9_9FABA|nr:uncharacterized protein G2W53_017465 [Senna tora]